MSRHGTTSEVGRCGCRSMTPSPRSRCTTSCFRAASSACSKASLEPLPTNKVSPSGQHVPTLPKSEVRATVYRALQRLPIDTLDGSSRHMLKSSGIGPVLKFYSQVKDEDPANRRLVNDLLTTWMAPIVEEGRKAVMDNEYEGRRREVRRR